jgi:polyhydroxybutyrate depolymerase
MLACCCLLLAACGGGASSSSSDPAQNTSSSPAAGGSGSSATGTSSFSKTIHYGGFDRQVLYIKPVSQSGSAPALVMLPYQGGSPSSMAEFTRASRLAADYGAWVILPADAIGKWNDDPGNPVNNVDDVGFLATVIADAAASYPVDPSRIYMTGYSNSGFMAERFACERADLIAGIAPVATTERYTEQSVCKPSRPVPAAFFNGTNDLIVPYNGMPALLLSAPATFSQWESYNGCGSRSVANTSFAPQVNDGTSVQLAAVGGCSGNSRVSLYTIEGGGHTWPGNQSGLVDELYLGTTSHNLDATIAMWQFLTQ